MSFKRALGASLFGLLIAIAAPAEATITQALSLRELVGRADHIVLATCVDRQTRRDGIRRIVTDHTVTVEDAVDGHSRVGEALIMRRLGGSVGDVAMRIEGEPTLALGEHYLLFLSRSEAGNLRPVGMSQGVMRVREEMVEPGGGGLSLVQRASGGDLVVAPGAILHPEPWGRVRERVVSFISGTSTTDTTAAP